MEFAINFQNLDQFDCFNVDLKEMCLTKQNSAMNERQNTYLKDLVAQLSENFSELKVSRIYFGSEFCDKLIPDLKAVMKAYNFAQKYNIAFTLLTALVPDSGLDKLKILFDYLNNEAHGAEIVVNDFGVLSVLHREYKKLVPVAGRLLGKMTNDPRIKDKITILKKVPLELGTLKFIRNSAFSVPAFQQFLNNNGVNRGEFDTVYQGIDYDIEDRLTFSIHMPYNYITSGRYCFIGALQQPDIHRFAINAPCQEECVRYVVKLCKEAMEDEIYNRGKVVVNKMSKDIELKNYVLSDKISRIVITPFIPY